MTSAGTLLLVVGLAVVLADRFAHHDELAARRFRELDPRIVHSALDQLRNRRWHRAGFWLRLLVVLFLAGAFGVASLSWHVAGLTLVVAGSLVSLLFDILFNLRFGMEWHYAGTTAWTDEMLNKIGLVHHLTPGQLSAALELSMALAGAAAWLIIL